MVGEIISTWLVNGNNQYVDKNIIINSKRELFNKIKLIKLKIDENQILKNDYRIYYEIEIISICTLCLDMHFSNLG